MNPIRLYRIRHSWRRHGRLFWATTTWGFRGTPNEALNDFTSKRSEIVSCCVEGEVV